MSTSESRMRCVKCDKTKDISKMRIYFESNIPNESTQVLQEIKLHNKDISNEFESAR